MSNIRFIKKLFIIIITVFLVSFCFTYKVYGEDDNTVLKILYEDGMLVYNKNDVDDDGYITPVTIECNDPGDIIQVRYRNDRFLLLLTYGTKLYGSSITLHSNKYYAETNALIYSNDFLVIGFDTRVNLIVDSNFNDNSSSYYGIYASALSIEQLNEAYINLNYDLSSLKSGNKDFIGISSYGGILNVLGSALNSIVSFKMIDDTDYSKLSSFNNISSYGLVSNTDDLLRLRYCRLNIEASDCGVYSKGPLSFDHADLILNIKKRYSKVGVGIESVGSAEILDGNYKINIIDFDGDGVLDLSEYDYLSAAFVFRSGALLTHPSLMVENSNFCVDKNFCIYAYDDLSFEYVKINSDCQIYSSGDMSFISCSLYIDSLNPCLSFDGSLNISRYDYSYEAWILKTSSQDKFALYTPIVPSIEVSNISVQGKNDGEFVDVTGDDILFYKTLYFGDPCVITYDFGDYTNAFAPKKVVSKGYLYNTFDSYSNLDHDITPLNFSSIYKDDETVAFYDETINEDITLHYAYYIYRLYMAYDNHLIVYDMPLNKCDDNLVPRNADPDDTCTSYPTSDILSVKYDHIKQAFIVNIGEGVNDKTINLDTFKIDGKEMLFYLDLTERDSGVNTALEINLIDNLNVNINYDFDESDALDLNVIEARKLSIVGDGSITFNLDISDDTYNLNRNQKINYTYSRNAYIGDGVLRTSVFTNEEIDYSKFEDNENKLYVSCFAGDDIIVDNSYLDLNSSFATFAERSSCKLFDSEIFVNQIENNINKYYFIYSEYGYPETCSFDLYINDSYLNLNLNNFNDDYVIYGLNSREININNSDILISNENLPDNPLNYYSIRCQDININSSYKDNEYLHGKSNIKLDGPINASNVYIDNVSLDFTSKFANFYPLDQYYNYSLKLGDNIFGTIESLSDKCFIKGSEEYVSQYDILIDSSVVETNTTSFNKDLFDSYSYLHFNNSHVINFDLSNISQYAYTSFTTTDKYGRVNAPKIYFRNIDNNLPIIDYWYINGNKSNRFVFDDTNVNEEITLFPHIHVERRDNKNHNDSSGNFYSIPLTGIK